MTNAPKNVIVVGPPRFAGEDLAHPLLPRDSRVANSVELGGDGPGGDAAGGEGAGREGTGGEGTGDLSRDA